MTTVDPIKNKDLPDKIENHFQRNQKLLTLGINTGLAVGSMALWLNWSVTPG